MLYNPSNKKTAEVMMALMQYVIKYDYYPNDYFYLLELQKNYSDDVISHIEFDTAINDLHNQWSLILLKNN